ncbi:MAG: hypothetical protein AMXMBFR83_24640 [Phycisphaerae bacterium]
MGRRGLPFRAFTLLEVLVTAAMIALLVAILVPALASSRRQAQATICLGQLHTLGHGLSFYAQQYREVLPPSRLPDLGDRVNWRVQIRGGLKYRPTFLSILASSVGIPPFAQPMPTRDAVDAAGQKGSQQNYISDLLVCPGVPGWRDERNGSYGYNYQFLGNSRLRIGGGPTDFKNWPVAGSRIRSPVRCVAVADSLGTAASFAQRREYLDNARDPDRAGNEGFNLDPPTVDRVDGEMADLDTGVRTAVHGRHSGRGAVLWLDLHASAETPGQLGYLVAADGIVALQGRNHLFHPTGRDAAWQTSEAR